MENITGKIIVIEHKSQQGRSDTMGTIERIILPNEVLTDAEVDEYYGNIYKQAEIFFRKGKSYNESLEFVKSVRPALFTHKHLHRLVIREMGTDKYYTLPVDEHMRNYYNWTITIH